MKPLTGTSTASMPSNFVKFKGTEPAKGFKPYKYNNNYLLIIPQTEGWFEVDSIDLTGVKSVNVTCMWQAPPEFSFDFEARLNAPDGKLIGKGSMPVPARNAQMGAAHIKLDPVTGGQFQKIYFVFKPVNPKGTLTAGIGGLQFDSK